MTDIQSNTLEFIQLYIDKYKRSPTYAEIAIAFNIRDGAAFERVSHLAKQGYVQQGRGHRSIRILRRLNGTVR